MGNHLTQTEDKFFLFMQHAPAGMAEIDNDGNIVYLNPLAETILKPVKAAYNIKGDNLLNILEPLAADLLKKIRAFIEEGDNTPEDKFRTFPLAFKTGKQERYFNIGFNKIYPGSIVVCFEDVAENHVNDKTIQEVLTENAMIQGKFEIASNILHDIGNAVVGISSYLTRIKKAMELDNSANLLNLVAFFETQHSAIAGALGEAKADALVKLISSIAQTEKSNQNDIAKSLAEQQNIIKHIQDILNIQRQYVNGSVFKEARPSHLESIINDCMSMLYASLNKRNISATIDIPENLPNVKGERTKLMQVILNILKNSIEAIDFYSINKTISLSVSQHSGYLLLHIRDSGKGFDEFTGRQLFKRGFTTKNTGTGLGLDHCRAILENQGGSIDITSDGPGKGALATIKFII